MTHPHFSQNGFIKTSIFSPSDIDAVQQALLEFFAYAMQTEYGDFDKMRISLANQYADPALLERFKAAARIMNHLPIFTALGSSAAVLKVAKQLGLTCPVVSTYPEVRTDFPGDTQYMQQFHQDWPYAQTSSNAITIWTALHDVTQEDGALNVIKGSHRRGLMPTKVERHPRKFLVEPSSIEADSIAVETCRAGQSILFDQHLVHASGRNQSNAVRITFQIRLADAFDKPWQASGYSKVDKDTYSIRTT